MNISLKKRDQIVASARMLFLEHGFGATSMDVIAENAGVSKRTVYNHFKDKKALFSAIIETVCKETCPTDFDRPDLSQGAEQVLIAIGIKYLTANLAPQAIDLLRVVAAESATFPELGKLLWESGAKQLTQFISDYLVTLEQEGVLIVTNPDVVAIQFLGMIKEPFYLPLLFGIGHNPSKKEIKTTVEYAVSILLAGLKP